MNHNQLIPVDFLFEGHDLRLVNLDNEPWFVAADLERILDLKNIRQNVALLAASERGVSTVYTPGGAQQMTIVNESGLYALIFQSRKPSALAFRQWVTGTVLPQIRRFGGYVVPQNYASALRMLADTTQAYEDAKQTLTEQAPKVEAYDKFIDMGECMSMSDAAKALSSKGASLGGNTLFKVLREHAILCSYGDNYNHPRQEYVDRGYFQLKTSLWKHPQTGEPQTRLTTVVTPRGLVWVEKKLREWGYLKGAKTDLLTQYLPLNHDDVVPY